MVHHSTLHAIYRTPFHSIFILQITVFVLESKKQKSIMADVDCSSKTNVAKKRKMMTSKQMSILLGKSNDQDPESPHPDSIQQKHKIAIKC